VADQSILKKKSSKKKADKHDGPNMKKCVLKTQNKTNQEIEDLKV